MFYNADYKFLVPVTLLILIHKIEPKSKWFERRLLPLTCR